MDAIRVQIELGDPLRQVTVGRAFRKEATALEECFKSIMAQFGVDRDVLVEVVTGHSRRPISIRVGGVLQRPSDADVRAAWAAAAAEHLDLLPDSAEKGASRLPGAWLPGLVSLLPKRSRQDVVATLIRELAFYLVRHRPGDLLVGAVAPVDAAVSGRLDASPPASTARYLAAQGIYPARHPEMADAIEDALHITNRADDLAEILIASCPHRRVELVIGASNASNTSKEGTVLLDLRGDDHDLVLQSVDRWLQDDLGLRLPPVGVVADPELPLGSVAVRINDVTGIAIRLPAHDEFVVEARANILKDRGIDGRATLLPREFKIGCLVPSEQRDLLDSSFQVWDRKETVALLLRYELERLASRLVTLPAVEFAIGQLEPYAPDLVQEALSRFSTPEITRISRALIDEGVPVRDLEAVLERLVQFREVPVNSPDESLLDDAIPMNPAIATYPEIATRRHVTWVRSGLAGLIGERFSQRPRGLFIAQIDDELDTRMSLLGWEGRGPLDDFDDNEWDETVDSMLHRVMDGLPAAVSAVVLTSRRARPVVRELLARDAPAVRVLAVTEIDWNLELIFMEKEGGPMAVTVALVKDRAEQILRAELGEGLQRWPDGRMSFVYEGTEVIVYVEPWEDQTVVTTWAELMAGVRPSPELFEYFAREVSDRTFGHVVTVPDDEDRLRLIFSHRILGDFLDPDELVAVAVVVALAAHEIRDELATRFGGLREETAEAVVN